MHDEPDTANGHSVVTNSMRLFLLCVAGLVKTY